MNECNSIEVANTCSNLSDQTKFRLNEINKIKDYFNSEIQERKIMRKKHYCKTLKIHCCF